MNSNMTDNKIAVGMVDGAIYRIDPRDFGSSKADGITPLNIDIRDLPEYNQYKEEYSKHACTIVNALKDACFNYNIKLTLEMMLQCIYYCVAESDYIIGSGWGTNDAMEAVRKFLIEEGYPAVYLRLNYKNSKLMEYLNGGYMVGATFRGNSDYVFDYAKDGILDGTDFDPYTFGHRTSIMLREGSPGGSKKIYVWDSEYGFKYNQYELKHFIKLIEDGTYYPTFYIRTLKEDMTDTPEVIVKDMEREKELSILINALSICWKHFDNDAKDKVHELAEKARHMLS